MKSAIVFALTTFGAAASFESLKESSLQAKFAAWMVENDKTYEAEETFVRYDTFKANVQFIEEHNQRYQNGLETYHVALNQFSDMDVGEYKRTMLGYDSSLRKDSGFDFPSLTRLGDVTGALNWTAKGAVTAVKNQGQCGSCWAFSTTGSMEGAIQIQSSDHHLTSLSEQQLVDCSIPEGNLGCNGGLMDNAFKYAEGAGLCSESAYPYQAKRGTCVASSCSAQPNTKLSSYADVKGGENGLDTPIQSQPISIAIEADQAGFQFYSGGVFSGTCGQNLDHGVLLTGYGDQGTTPYWIVKNSWGTSWGEAGYIRMIRGQDECGLGNEPSYPHAGSN